MEFLFLSQISCIVGGGKKDFFTALLKTPFVCARKVTIFKETFTVFNRKTECVWKM